VTDAEGAARSVVSGQATGIPKSADGNVEMIRVLRVARRSAMRAKISTINQLHALVVSAP
jgi:transposase